MHQQNKRKYLCNQYISVSYRQYQDITKLQQSQKLLMNDLASSITQEKAIKMYNAFRPPTQKELYFQSQQDLATNQQQFHTLILRLIDNIKIQKQFNSFSKKLHRAFQYTLKPDNPIVYIWNLLLGFIILHTILCLPLADSFGMPFSKFEHQYFEQIILFEFIVLILDIILQFNVQQFYQGEVISSKKDILYYYLKTNFLQDILSLFGFIIYRRDFILVNCQCSDKLLIENILKYIFALKLFGLNKQMGLFKRIFDYNHYLKHYFKLIELFGFLFILAHFLACLWVLTANLSSVSDNQNWITTQFQYNQPDHIYIKSLYFAAMTMTTVGYGDIHGENPTEYLVSVFIMIASSGIFAYSLNAITQILQEISKQKSKYKREIEIMENYMKKRKIDITLQTRIINYLTSMEKAGLYDDQNEEQQIISKLNPQLMQELLLQDKGKIYSNIPFFKNHFSDQFILDIVKHTNEIRLSPGEYLKKQNKMDEAIDHSFIYVAKGSVDILTSLKKTNQSIVKLFGLKQHERFGIQNLFGNSCEYFQKFSIQSTDFTVLYQLKREDFEKVILMQNHSDREMFCLLKEKISISNNRELLELKCKYCNQLNHDFSKCSKLHFIPMRKLAIARAQKSQQQERRSYIRFICYNNNIFRQSFKKNTLSLFNLIQRSANEINLQINLDLISENSESGKEMENEDSMKSSSKKKISSNTSQDISNMSSVIIFIILLFKKSWKVDIGENVSRKDPRQLIKPISICNKNKRRIDQVQMVQQLLPTKQLFSNSLKNICISPRSQKQQIEDFQKPSEIPNQESNQDNCQEKNLLEKIYDYLIKKEQNINTQEENLLNIDGMFERYFEFQRFYPSFNIQVIIKYMNIRANKKLLRNFRKRTSDQLTKRRRKSLFI